MLAIEVVCDCMNWDTFSVYTIHGTREVVVTRLYSRYEHTLSLSSLDPTLPLMQVDSVILFIQSSLGGKYPCLTKMTCSHFVVYAFVL